MCVIKIGGTNGSGKTTLARAFMALWNFEKVTADCVLTRSLSGPVTDQLLITSKKKVLEYRARIKSNQQGSAKFNKAVILGNYEIVCGGMDAVSGKDLRLALIEQYCGKADKKTLVVYDGVLTGVTYGAAGKLSELSAVPWIYAFMDTPYSVCVQRVEARRQAKGNVTVFDGMKSLHPKIRACESVARRAEAAGHRVVWVDHKKSADEQARALLLIACKL
jgi:thymidylate kinase